MSRNVISCECITRHTTLIPHVKGSASRQSCQPTENCSSVVHLPVSLFLVMGTITSRLHVIRGSQRPPKINMTLADLESNHARLRAKLDTIPEETLIFFWTRSATFYLKNDESQFGGPSVLDSNGKAVGSTRVMSTNVDASAFDQECEFIVVGSRRNDFSERTPLVLLIKWEEDIAYRVNIGEIFEEDWLKAPSTWKLISLG